MRKDTFKKYMEGGSKYLSLQHLEQMTLEQRAEFRKYHNPWVVWLDEISDENYTGDEKDLELEAFVSKFSEEAEKTHEIDE